MLHPLFIPSIFKLIKRRETKTMEIFGTVRKVDATGRIALPAEMRRTLGLTGGDLLGLSGLGLGPQLSPALQEHRAEGRNPDGYGTLLAVGGDPLHLAGGAVHRPGAAVNGRVGVEDLHVLLYLGTAEAVIIIGVGIEIDGAQQFLAGFVPAEEHHHIVLVVVGHPSH